MYTTWAFSLLALIYGPKSIQTFDVKGKGDRLFELIFKNL